MKNLRLKLLNTIGVVLTLGMPLIAQAQTLNKLIATAFDIINYSIGLLIGVAIVCFFWGLVKYLFSAKGGPDQKKASTIMVWGLLGLFCMLSVYGIIRLLQNGLGISGSIQNAPSYGNTASPSCSSATQNIACLAAWVASLFGIGTALLAGGAIVVYFWGIASNMFGYSAAGSAASVKKLRTNLLWGLLALFIMFSIWGIVRLLGSALFGSTNFNSLL